MLKICLTYDYELFLGKNNATYEEILFNPTDSLLETMSERGVSGTFFVDVCSAIAHREHGLLQYAERFDKQLQRMILMGQDVQLHIHSNWFYAQNNDGILCPSDKGYRIHDFPFNGETRSVCQIISEGKEYLEKVCSEVDPAYKCVGYRAGGFAFQPECKLIQVLIDNGIYIESSVVPRMKSILGANSYDYTHVPRKLNWWVSSYNGVNVDASQHKGAMFEVPVATARPRLLQLLGTKRNERSLPSRPILGEYVKAQGKEKKQCWINNMLQRFFGYRYISLDTRYYLRVLEDLEYLYRKHNLEKTDGYVCLICHPKLADQDRIDNIKRLIQVVASYNDKYEFVTITDIYNEILGEKNLKEEKNADFHQ